MTTSVSPSLGNPALILQQGIGTTPGYSAIDARRMMSTGLQEGVDAGTDWMVVQRAAGGAAMFVDITLATGFAKVQGDSVTAQGLYTVAPHSALITEALTTADASNPRVDQVILEILDNVHDATGSNLARTRVLAGTPTGGATLANRTGATALPSNCVRLADVLVGAAVSSVDNTKIRDRRPWCKGAYVRIVRNTNAAAGNDYSTTSSSFAAIDSTNLNPRLECSGVPSLEVGIEGTFQSGAANALSRITVGVDGTAPDGGAYTSISNMALNSDIPVAFHWPTTPTAGSHQVAPFFSTGSGTILIYCRSTIPLVLTIKEGGGGLRASAANNSVTSG